MDLYVYYRVRRESADELCRRLAAMQQSLSREHGVATALKRRPDEKDGLHTWMEVYLATPQGFEAALQRAADEARLAEIIEGPRHTEHFLDYSPCA